MPKHAANKRVPLRVLVVEDSVPDAELSLEELKRAGYAVTAEVADTRGQVEHFFRNSSCDIVLADYRLPGWTGLEVLQLLRECTDHVPMILVTGSLGEESAVDCVKLGASDYVLKHNLIRLGPAVERAVREAARAREQAMTEHALRDSERRYRRLFERNVAGIFSNTLDGRLVNCNAANARIYGYDSPEQMLAECQTIRQLYADPKDRERFLALLRENGTVANWECCQWRRDGKPVWVLENASLVRDETSGSELVEGTLVDITERKAAEDAIRRSEEEFRSRIEHAPAAIYTAEIESGQIVSANRAMLKLLGLTAEAEALSLKVSDLYLDPEVRRIVLRELMATGRVADKEVRWKPPRDGKPLIVRITERLYQKSDGATYVDCLAADVTESKLLAAQLQQAQKMEAIGQLAGGIAHDFNNMLMIIGSYAEFLRDSDLPPEKSQSFLNHIVDATRKAASLTQQLLAFSRRQVLSPTLLDLNTVLAEHKKMLPRLIGEHISVVTHAGPKAALVEADAVQIDQVLMNLATNARDSMPDGGILTLETSVVVFDQPHSAPTSVIPAGEYIVLAVSDTGCGMDAEIQAHIFEPFFTTKGKGKGTGLGLAMVYGIVKQSGGYISVYSEKGIGTTFKIYLPQVQKIKETKEERVWLPVLCGKETVLVVEDEEPLRLVLKEFLLANGYTVRDAATGAEALELTADDKTKPDILVTDIVLPGMRGTELARQLKEKNRQLRVLYISGYADRALSDRKMLDEGCTFLQKPFSLRAFARMVRFLLNAEPAGSVEPEEVPEVPA